MSEARPQEPRRQRERGEVGQARNGLRMPATDAAPGTRGTASFDAAPRARAPCCLDSCGK
jgi:hypothetical protein